MKGKDNLNEQRIRKLVKLVFIVKIRQRVNYISSKEGVTAVMQIELIKLLSWP